MAAAGGAGPMKDQRWGEKSDDHHLSRSGRDKDDSFNRGRGPIGGGPQEHEKHGFGGRPGEQFSSMEEYFSNEVFGRGGAQPRRMPINPGPNPGMANAGMRQPISQPYMHPKEDMMGGGFVNPQGQGMPMPLNAMGNPNLSGPSGYYGGGNAMPGAQYPYMPNNMGGYGQNSGAGNPNMGPGHFRFQPSSGRPEPPLEFSMRKMGSDNPPFFNNYPGGNPEPSGTPNRAMGGGMMWSGNRGPNEMNENIGRDDRQRGFMGPNMGRKEGGTSDKGGEGYYQSKTQERDYHSSSQKMHIEEKRGSEGDPNDNLEEGEMVDNSLLKNKEVQKLMELFLKNPGDKRIQKLLEKAKGE